MPLLEIVASTTTATAGDGIATQVLLLAVVVLLAVMIYLFRGFRSGAGNREAIEEEAQKISDRAIREAKELMMQNQQAAQEDLAQKRKDLENSFAEKREEVKQLEARLHDRERVLDRKMDQIEGRTEELNRREDLLRDKKTELEDLEREIAKLQEDQTKRLEEISGLSQDQAREQILNELDEALEAEKGQSVRRHMEDLKSTCNKQAQNLLVNAIQRYSGDCTYERTVAIVPLPSDEMKGRIIGREGRNIRVIEAKTGASVLVDDTPDAVVVSCFDPVRKEIARLTMERLIEDGRIHPTRIEETIEKVKEDIDAQIMKAGEEAITALGLSGFSNHITSLIGRLKFRYSYSQNVLKHSIEVARMMEMIAAEMGLDTTKAKRMGLLHDIGKAVDHEVEGSHALIGMDILKRAGEDAEVINGVGCHHEEVAAESPLAVLVAACDTISAGRPGARCETTEIYLRRLHQLEEIGAAFEGVSECFAIQGGRELRVIVNARDVKESNAYNLARNIAGEIEAHVKYPGQIKVTVLRETRAVEYAK